MCHFSKNKMKKSSFPKQICMFVYIGLQQCSYIAWLMRLCIVPLCDIPIPTPNQKLACFVLILKIINTFL